MQGALGSHVAVSTPEPGHTQKAGVSGEWSNGQECSVHPIQRPPVLEPECQVLNAGAMGGIRAQQPPAVVSQMPNGEDVGGSWRAWASSVRHSL